jgi:hypothetical protein
MNTEQLGRYTIVRELPFGLSDLAFDTKMPNESEKAMEIDEATEIIFRAALKRLGPEARLDPLKLQEQIAEVIHENGEAIFAQLSAGAREHLRTKGFKLNEHAVKRERIRRAIAYGCFLIAKFSAETVGELPEEEQSKFALLWANAPGAARPHEN